MTEQQKQSGDGEGYDFSNFEDELRMDFELTAEHTLEFLDKVGIGKGWHVLEIGCGFAFLLDFYLKRVGPSGSVTLSDPEAKFGEKLAPRLGDNVRFVTSGGEEVGEKCRCLGNADGYDLVVLGNVFHHLKSVDETLSAVKSVLRSGGVAVVFDFLLYSFRLFTSVPTQLPQLLGPPMDSVPARCVELLTGAGLSVRREHNFVLRGKPGSDLWQMYMGSFVPMLLDERRKEGHLTQEQVDCVVASELPAVAKDAGAVLFGDVILQVAAAKQ